MLIVWYKLPSPDGEDVLVMEEPMFECEPAILLTKSDRGKPYFFIDVDVGEITVSAANGDMDVEPYVKMYDEGFEGLLPARNADEAHAFARRLYERIIESREPKAE